MTQTEAAQKLGIAQSRVSDLMRGQWEKFSLAMLIRLEVRLGRQVQLEWVCSKLVGGPVIASRCGEAISTWVGGNDALQQAHLLFTPEASTEEAIGLLADLAEQFEHDYRAAAQA